MAKPATATGEKLSTQLSGLKLSTSNPKKAPVADSWDDEDPTNSDDNEQAILDSEEREDSLAALPQKKQTHKRAPSDYPNAPPPTPSMLSPSLQASDWQSDYQSMGAAFDSPMSMQKNERGSTGDDKRPEKSTAVASRLIAAGLGVKAPKRTEEQRAYEKSVREQERKKKEKEIVDKKKAAEEKERAKRSVWED